MEDAAPLGISDFKAVASPIFESMHVGPISLVSSIPHGGYHTRVGAVDRSLDGMV